MEKIFEFRKKIDSYLNSIKYLNGSREISLVHTNLQRSFMWLGESLKAAGSKSPYSESYNAASKAIEPLADHTEDSLVDRWTALEQQTQTARVKDFRSVIGETIEQLKHFRYNNDIVIMDLSGTGTEQASFNECLTESFLALKEAQCFLGWELGRIRKEQNPDGIHFEKTVLAL